MDRVDLCCPECGAARPMVYKTIPGPGSVFRKRRCNECGHQLRTVEQIADADEGMSTDELEACVSNLSPLRDAAIELTVSLMHLGEVPAGHGGANRAIALIEQCEEAIKSWVLRNARQEYVALRDAVAALTSTSPADPDPA